MTDDEIERIADFLLLAQDEFIDQFTRLAANRHGLALQERADGDCVFLEGSDCAIQAVKPQQCQDFPHLWRNPGFEQTCRAKPRRV